MLGHDILSALLQSIQINIMLDHPGECLFSAMSSPEEIALENAYFHCRNNKIQQLSNFDAMLQNTVYIADLQFCKIFIIF